MKRRLFFLNTIAEWYRRPILLFPIPDADRNPDRLHQHPALRRPFMMALSTITVFFLVPGIVDMGIGFGAAYPDFKAENPAQTVTSFGDLVFMIMRVGYIGHGHSRGIIR